MSTITTQPNVSVLNPARGVREFSNPGDPATFLGVTGINFNVVLGATEILAGLPLALANNTGAVYLSAIHGGLGSDAAAPLALPAAGFNPNKPAFAGPETTGYFTTGPNANNPSLNGFYNTEKVQRSPTDNPAGNGTIWQGLQGRTKLNFQLWISDGGINNRMALELYRDLNAQDKVLGQFGAGTGPTDPRNAMLVSSWLAPPANRNTNLPNFATSFPVDLPSGCNLYLLFRNLAGGAGNLAVGSIWLS